MLWRHRSRRCPQRTCRRWRSRSPRRSTCTWGTCWTRSSCSSCLRRSSRTSSRSARSRHCRSTGTPPPSPRCPCTRRTAARPVRIGSHRQFPSMHVRGSHTALPCSRRGRCRRSRSTGRRGTRCSCPPLWPRAPCCTFPRCRRCRSPQPSPPSRPNRSQASRGSSCSRQRTRCPSRRCPRRSWRRSSLSSRLRLGCSDQACRRCSCPGWPFRRPC